MIKRTKSSKKARVNKTAWILDAQVHQNGIMLWMIDREGNHFQALRCHYPYFYVVFSEDASRIAWSGSEIDEKNHIRLKRRYQGIQRSIQENDGVQSVQICERRVHAEDAVYRAALRVRVQSPFLFKSVINDLRELEMFE